MKNIDILKIIDIGGDFVAQEIIKRSKDKDIIYMTEDTLLNTNCVKQLAEYIETLIAENKELKEKNDRYEEIYKNYGIDDLVQELEKYRVENKELKEENFNLKQQKIIDKCSIPSQDNFYDYYNYIPKSKVKEEIKEVDIQLQKLKDELTGRKTNFVNKNMLFAQKEVLQSLLGKE